ncbi:helix-turn-helix domain-containing protein [Amycolatopsis nigrescens]|uniref:helix-turn-helix domain-containing protein n=1 Tax=Amycolatopsis nigrescens TaxID=381445 RepID=UPI0012F97112|nr:XRE family transcriptional regulator [Amycolatopsis nigrescens]
MGDMTIGPLLRDLREQSGRSQSEQAQLLSELAGRVVTRNEVSRWESEGRLLTPFWQKHHAGSFGVDVAELRRAVAAAKARRRSRPEEVCDPVQRRQFIGGLAGLALPRLGAEFPRGRRIGEADVDRLRRHTARLRRLDDVMGGGDTYSIYAAELRSTARLLNEGQYADEVGRALRSLLAEQAQLTGWAAFDAGRHARARVHYTTSLAAAEEAGDGALAGNALAFVAYQETCTARDGTKTAFASYEKARAVATPRVKALLLERKAWSYAVVGDARQTEDSLARAREVLEQQDDRREPDWVFWVDRNEVDIMAGRCWTELCRPLRAVPVLESVLSGFDDTHARDKALYLTWLAGSYLQAREVEQSASTLEKAFELANGVASVRPSARITNVARKLAVHRAVPEVGAALERIGS